MGTSRSLSFAPARRGQRARYSAANMADWDTRRPSVVFAVDDNRDVVVQRLKHDGGDAAAGTEPLQHAYAVSPGAVPAEWV
jgi:hypothetical protein